MVQADFDFFTDDFPYFEITNTLGYLAILFRRYGSFFQVASNSPQNQCFYQKNVIVLDSIILFLYYLKLIKHSNMFLFEE